MHHAVGACQERRQPGLAGLGAVARRQGKQIVGDQREPLGGARAGQIRLFIGTRIVVFERVDAHHLAAVGQQTIDEMRAYEAGRAGHHDPAAFG